MASLPSATVEGCEYEKKSSTAAFDVIDDGGGSRKSSPVIDDGDIELDSSGNSSPDTAAVGGNYSLGELHWEALRKSIINDRLFEQVRLRRWYEREVESRMEPITLSPLLAGRPVWMTDFEPKGGREEEERTNGQEGGYYLEDERRLREYVWVGIDALFTPEIESGVFPRVPTCLSIEHLFHSLSLGVTDVPRYLRDGRPRLPNGMFGHEEEEVEPGNWETGHLIAGMRFGRGSADLTPTNPDFRLEIMDHAVEPEVANLTSIMLEEQQPPHSRFNQAMIVLYVLLELFATAFVMKYEESQMVAYFSMSTVCYLSAMYTAHLLAPLEGGNERFSVYLRGSSFVFLGLLRFLGINQGSFVTALKIILGMSQVVLYWWTSGILQTYMNAFGMRRT